MEQLSKQDERTVLRFTWQLWNVSGPDDMFPPDESGDRKELEPIDPITPNAARLTIDGISKTLQHIELVLSQV